MNDNKSVLCLIKLDEPDDFVKNNSGEILIFDNSKQIELWSKENSIDLNEYLVYQVEVVDD